MLSGHDYGEIENLYARYSQGSDFRDAELFLSAFSEDATIVRADSSSIDDEFVRTPDGWRIKRRTINRDTAR